MRGPCVSTHTGASCLRAPASIHPGQSCQGDRFRSCAFQYCCAGAGRSAGRHHIVDQQNSLTRNIGPGAQHKGSRNIAAAAGHGEARLHLGGAFAPEHVHQRDIAARRDVASEKFSLIEASLPLPAPVQRDGSDGIKAFIDGDGPFQKPRESQPSRFLKKLAFPTARF